MKKYLLADLVVGVALVACTGILSAAMSHTGITEQAVKRTVDIFGTITGSVYLTNLITRIKSGDFEKRMSKAMLEKTLILSAVLILARLLSSLFYFLIKPHHMTAAVILSVLLDLAGFFTVCGFLPGKEKEANE